MGVVFCVLDLVVVQRLVVVRLIVVFWWLVGIVLLWLELLRIMLVCSL